MTTKNQRALGFGFERYAGTRGQSEGVEWRGRKEGKHNDTTLNAHTAHF